MAFFPKSKARLRREAADWLARMQGEPSEGDRERFRLWYEADEAQADAYDRLSARWQQAAFLRPEPTRGSQVGRDALRFPRTGALALAAAVLVSLALAVLLLGSRSLAPQSDEDFGEQVRLASALEEMRPVQLADGSHILLDADSSVLVRLTSAERLIELERGRARFMVARESRPFSVSTALGRVVAKGTTFDVSLRTGRMGIFLLEGKVEVEGAAKTDRDVSITLAPGEKLSLAEDGQRSRVVKASRSEALWPDVMLQFEALPLDQVLTDANRYSARKILLGDPGLASLRVTGAYRAGDVDGLARTLGDALGLAVASTSEGHLILIGRTVPSG